MSDPIVDAPARRSRGKSFPTLPLRAAIQAVKDAGNYGQEHSLTAFAQYLGHSSANSGPFRSKMSALKDWGLIDRQGDTVRLTDLAIRIAHPSSDADELVLVREAFYKATLFADIYENSAKETELNLDYLGNRAVTQMGVSAKSKQRFAKAFAESVEAAQLGRVSGDRVRLIPVDAESVPADSGKQDPAAPDPPADTAASQTPAPALPRPSELPTIHQEWEVAEGSVLFEVRLDGALPGSAFATLAEVMGTVEKLVASLSPAENSPEETDDASE